MFSSDGLLLLGLDKRTIMHQVETLVQSAIVNDQQIEGADEVNTEHVILVHGMAVEKSPQIGTVHHKLPTVRRSVFQEYKRIII